MKRVIIVHRWEGAPDADWYPWLKRELEKKNIKVHIPAMPDPARPKIEAWVGKLREEVKNPNEDTFFMGHSVGCQTILRYLETLPEKTTVGGVLFVAGWLTLNLLETAEEKIIAKPWLEQPMDSKKIVQMVKERIALFSDDDPFVPLENAKLFEQRCRMKVIIEKNQGHYNAKKIPSILQNALEMLKTNQPQKGF